MWPLSDYAGHNVLRCFFSSYGTVYKLLHVVTLDNTDRWNVTFCSLVDVRQYTISIFQEDNPSKSMFLYVCVYTHTHTQIYIYIYIYTYIYIYIYKATECVYVRHGALAMSHKIIGRKDLEFL